MPKRASRAVSISEYRSHANPLFIKYNQRYLTYVIITLVYSLSCYHPHLITCFKLMLKTMIIILEMH